MIYENIKRLAKEKGITVRKIEQDLGLSNGSIGKYDHAAPSVYRAFEIAKYLGCTVYDLIGETESNE